MYKNSKILVIANDTFSLFKLRYDLLKLWVSKGLQVYAVGPDDEYADKMKEIGVTYHKLEYKRVGTNPFSDMKLYKMYRQYINQLRPDIVFSYNLKPNIHGIKAAYKSGCRRIFAMIPGAGYVFSDISMKTKLLKGLISPLYRSSLKKATNVFFQNPDDKKEFLRLKLVNESQSVQLYGSGVNMDEFKVEPLPQQMSFVFVARLLKVKGIQEYCKAAQEVRKHFPDTPFHVVGGADDNPTCIDMKELEAFIASGDIIYHGRVDDVRPYLKQSSVMVLPSYHREGVPHSILEAMAMGRAVITTNNIGCRETVIEGKNGLFVNQQDYRDLAEKILWCCNNPDLVHEMGKQSYEFCREKFDVKIVNNIIWDAISNIERRGLHE